MATVLSRADMSSTYAPRWLGSALAALGDDSHEGTDRLHSIEVVSVVRRPVCTLYRLRWNEGDQQLVARAKQYRDWRLEKEAHGLSASTVPRLFAPPAFVDKAPFEFAASKAIYVHFQGADDRFAAVRPLAVLPAEQTIVLEELPQQNLATLLSHCHPFRKHKNDNILEEAFVNAGAWLRRFHEMTALPHTQQRHGHRDEVLDGIGQAVDFISSVVGHCKCFEYWRRCAGAAWPQHSPALPGGLNHADFAPRNVLVGPQSQVAVIDTLARWHAPIYEDIAHFLVAMETTELQLLSQGLAFARCRLDELRQCFVNGYFHDQSPPWAAIRVFELQAVLYKWVAVVAGLQESTGVRRLAKRGRAMLRNRFLSRYAARVVQEMQS